MNIKILLTGATGGVGKEIAKILCRTGATVVITGTNDKKLKTLAAEINASNGKGKIIPLAFDLTKLDEIEKFSIECLGLLGKKIDILINNAGIGYHSKIENINRKELEDVFKVNALAPILLTSALLPHIKKNGKVINVSSYLGVKAIKNTATYTASKHALEGFSKVLRLECADRGISVTTIQPGSIETDFNARTHDSEMIELFATRKLTRIAPRVIAELILNVVKTDSNACIEIIRIMPTEQAV
ncbi:MAG: SDR family oxidoreductase [bacterium]